MHVLPKAVIPQARAALQQIYAIMANHQASLVEVHTYSIPRGRQIVSYLEMLSKMT